MSKFSTKLFMVTLQIGKKFSTSPQQNLHNAVIFQLGEVKKDKRSCKNIASEIARDINSLAPEANILQ